MTEWLGVGLKYGGMLIGIGGEQFEGVAVGVSDDVRGQHRYVDISSIRYGLGLGVAAGVSIFVSNASNIDKLDGTTSRVKLGNSFTEFVANINVNLAVPGIKAKFDQKITAAAQPLQRVLGDLPRLIAKIISKAGDVAEFRDAVSRIINIAIAEAGLAQGTEIAMVLDVPLPGASGGAEISIYWVSSEMTIRRYSGATNELFVGVPKKGWAWRYRLLAGGIATWKDLANDKMYGGGRWNAINDDVVINWDSGGWDICPMSNIGDLGFRSGITKTGGAEYSTKITNASRIFSDKKRYLVTQEEKGWQWYYDIYSEKIAVWIETTSGKSGWGLWRDAPSPISTPDDDFILINWQPNPHLATDTIQIDHKIAFDSGFKMKGTVFVHGEANPVTVEKQ